MADKSPKTAVYLKTEGALVLIGNDVLSGTIVEGGRREGAVRRFGFQVINTKVLQNLLVVENSRCNRLSVDIRD